MCCSFPAGGADADQLAAVTSMECKIGIHTFTNATAFSLTDKDLKIISIQSASTEANHMQFFGQVVVDVTADKITKPGTAEGTITIQAMTVGSTDSSSTTDASGSSTPETAIQVSLPVTIETDGEAIVYVTYEFNDNIIETPKLIASVKVYKDLRVEVEFKYPQERAAYQEIISALLREEAA